ncbi:hypothetical protein D3C86_1658900 [compost metagenome]
MALLGDRTDLRRLFQRVADPHFFDQRHYFFGQLLFDAAMHHQAAATDAALAGVEANAEDNRIGRCIQISVGEDDLRIFAAQFQADFLHVAGSGGHGQATDFSGAGERHHVDVSMFGNRLAHH